MKREVDIELLKKDALDIFYKGYACSESVIYAIDRAFDAGMPQSAIAMSSGFPWGFGGGGCLCGAMAGGSMCLGYFFGKQFPGDESGAKCQALSKELYDHFKENFGAACCRALIKGKERNSPERKKQCESYVAVSVVKTAEIIMRELKNIEDDHISVPISKETAKKLKAGDYVYLTGTIYTARDAAHKRMDDALKSGEALPVDLEGQLIYYMGPSPAREGRPIGSAGPTTASRMDKYAPKLLNLGLGGMIGKGKRSQAVIDGIVRNGCVYFAAVGGAGALLSKCIKKSEVVAYEDLGTEAVRKLEIEDFPVIVVIDSEGNNLYETAITKYSRG